MAVLKQCRVLKVLVGKGRNGSANNSAKCLRFHELKDAMAVLTTVISV